MSNHDKFLYHVISEFNDFFKSMEELTIKYMRQAKITGSKSKSDSGAKQPRQKKDPDAPKKARSAYIIFCQHVRGKYPEKFKDVPFKNQSAILSKEWGKLANEKKEVFNRLALRDKERFAEETARYQETKSAPKPQVVEEEEIDNDEIEIDEDEEIVLESQPKKKVKV